MTPAFNWGACSEVGLVRQINEDSKCHEPPLFAVADGMGGHLAGDVASALAIKTLISELERSDSLGAAVHEANRAIHAAALSKPQLAGMGTTLTALVAGEASAQIAHVGDSRAYLLRQASLTRLTQDHTVVSRLVQQGKLMPEDADRHPQRSYLERALGVDSEVEVDVHVLDLFPGDRVLLCSDGLFGMIDDDLIQQVLTGEKAPQRAAERLCEEAIHAGGADNVTTIVIDIAEVDRAALPQSSTSRSPGSPTPQTHTDTGPLHDPIRPGGSPTATSALRPAGQAASTGGAQPRAPRRRARNLAWACIVLVALGSGVIATRMWLASSWFVASLDGRVTIFSGTRGEVAGFNLSQIEKRTGLDSKSLPDIYQTRLEQGIPASSRSDALRVVADLQAKVAPQPGPPPAPAPSQPPA